MFIQTESTPNPATLKFLPGQTVLDLGTADFPNLEAAQKSPLAKRIFATGGVAGVFFGTDFVTVTKADDVAWDHIKPAILGAIMEHYQSGAPVMSGEAASRGAMAPHRTFTTNNRPTASAPRRIMYMAPYSAGCARGAAPPPPDLLPYLASTASEMDPGSGLVFSSLETIGRMIRKWAK